MAITIAKIVTRSPDTPRYSKALRRTVRHLELQEKLLRQASAHLQILEEHRRFQQLTMSYEATLAQSTQAELLQAQTTQAQALQAQVLHTPALQNYVLQTVDDVARETARLLTPIGLNWEYKATQELLPRELQYNPIQSLIRDLSYWETIQRQLVGPWPLVGPWRDEKTLRWLLWAFQEGDSDHQEAAMAELATMIRRPRLGREASFQLRQRSQLMRMSPSEYWRRVVLPQAFLFVWGASKVPRRIQLGGNGQGRLLDEQGRWTPQVPEDKLSKDLLASYLFDEIPKAAVCILTDQDYPKPSNELWHSPPLEKKDDQGTIQRIPRLVRLQPGELDLTRRPGHICGPLPDVMAILKLDLQTLATNASPRQRQILDLLLKGYRIKEIASALHITSQAVHAQLNRLQQKYEAG